MDDGDNLCGQVFSLLCERLPRVIDLLNPVGFSSLLCGLANARYFDEEAMELLTRKLWSMVPTLKIQVQGAWGADPAFQSLGTKAHSFDTFLFPRRPTLATHPSPALKAMP